MAAAASVFGLKPSARKPCDALAHVRILRGGCRRAVSGERRAVSGEVGAGAVR